MIVLKRCIAVVLAIPLLGMMTARAGEGEPVTKKEKVSFGALKAANLVEARKDALAWFKTTGKNDEASQKAFNAIWAQSDRPVLDLVSATLSLGDANAAKLLAEVRSPAAAAPLEIPAALKDTKASAYYRANLGLAYAKALSQRRVFEEALETLKSVKPEQVVDPAAYLFHRAVAEHALMQKEEATRSIVRLLDDALEVPERYKMVSILMAFDMQAWRDKDLASIARKMDNIERRLELSRGGPQTQKIQKEVVARLDEMIKELENKCNGNCNCNGGSCPNGGNPGSGTPSNPQQDSKGGQNSGPGQIDQKKLEIIAKEWGKLPEKDRAKAMQDMTRDMPPKFREVIEQYFRKLAASEPPPNPR